MDMVATASNVFSADPLIRLMKDVIQREENREILQTDFQPMLHLLLDLTTLFPDQRKEAQEVLKIWMQLLHNCLTEARSLLHRPQPGRPRRCLDRLIRNPRTLSQEINEWKIIHSTDPIPALRAEESEQPLSKDEAASEEIQPQSEAEVSDQPLSEDEATSEEIQPQSEAEESEQPLSEDEAASEVSEQPLSEGEAWMLFQRIAFKDGPVPTDNIQLCATNIVDACKGSRSAISVVAAAMIGKTSLLDWQTSLDSMKIADPSFRPENHPRIDPQLYQLLRWSYDALPTSDLKNCFLSSAIYGEWINVKELVQMWIAEGLVRSKQESHLMDMAIARTYVNLLLDRCFFHNATSNKEIQYSGWQSSDYQCIRVDGAIREMAMYIAENEHNCFLNDSRQRGLQEMQHFPTIHDNEDCKRISLRGNENPDCFLILSDLPSELPCPKLVSLILSDNSISVVPSGFLVGLTSLKVLDLSNNYMRSIPSSVGQLQQLQLLRLEGLEHLQELPEEIGQLSSLQFLNLRSCNMLQSLPSQIGQLQHLKYLNISQCWRLRVIPHEISQLTALTTLDVELSVEAESERSIFRLKGLINLTMLRIRVDVRNTSSGIEGGIMGTWLDMRHLELWFDHSRDDVIMDMRDLELWFDHPRDDLPDDMQNMRKLQSLRMHRYRGLSLPEYSCKFQHLQHLELRYCLHLKELSPLERLPNLKELELNDCRELKELGIGNYGKATGFSMLEVLVLQRLEKLESMAGASNSGVWNERTLPKLRILQMIKCPNLKRLPVGMDKLLSLKIVEGQNDWWQQIIWEDEHMKKHIASLFKMWKLWR